MRICQNIRTWFWASFFQNLNFFHFSWHVIWLVCRAVTIFYWRKELSLMDLSDTLNMFVKPIENFLETFEKKFQPKKWGFVKIFQPDFEFHIGAETFFQRLLENFL